MSNGFDQNCSAEAVSLTDSTRAIDDSIPRVRRTLVESTAVTEAANRDLAKHARWLERHHERYSTALKGFQRRLKRYERMRTLTKLAINPRSIASACISGVRWLHTYPRRARLRVELQDRINRTDLVD